MKSKICVIGLGYVGLVTAVKLAASNQNIIGVENDLAKYKSLIKGDVHFFEPNLGPTMKNVLKDKKLKFYNSLKKIEIDCNIFVVCVGTPTNKNGSFNFKYLENVCSDLINHLKQNNEYFVIIIRSTSLPGKTRKIFVERISKELKLSIETDFDVVMNPEFLREGSALKDYDNPSRTVLGVTSSKCLVFLKDIYKNIKAPFFVTDLETAELCKYIDNSWHALKVSFGNEIGAIAKALNIKSSDVYEIFTSDSKLNISKAYLKPGFAFGGSCLPKDLKALQTFSSSLNLNLPLLSSINDSNNEVIDRLINLIKNLNKSNLSFLGITFKMKTDDYRESPMITVIKNLSTLRQYNISVYDELLTNLQYPKFNDFSKQIKIAKSCSESILRSDIVLIFHNSKSYINNIKKYGSNKIIIDLVGIFEISNLKNYISFN